VILSRSTALSDFEKLFAVGNAEAKCYALAGVRTLDLNRFEELSRPLRDSKQEVVTMNGCIVSRELFGTILKRIEAGQYSKCKKCKIPRSFA
jgi:hypothetical protein